MNGLQPRRMARADLQVNHSRCLPSCLEEVFSCAPFLPCWVRTNRLRSGLLFSIPQGAQYNSEEYLKSGTPAKVIEYAFENGINAIDTSPVRDNL